MSDRPATTSTAAARGRFLIDAAAFRSRPAGRPFTEEDVRETTANLGGFFSVLREWEAKETAAPRPNQAALTRHKKRESPGANRGLTD